ncbi:uncharacterized protein LOC123296499 [Chrysoperla carnea]|uniref:uncharacterized protein LOC123296499 n=1 Tax=Chrysoperla carnea TaxID=189513 RepID=UPI001D06AF83|nr:uncharacterized protein LOC123296499 [Chrysoperla carnea]
MRARQLAILILITVGELIVAMRYPYQRNPETIMQRLLPKTSIQQLRSESMDSQNNYNAPTEMRQTRFLCIFVDLCATSIAQFIGGIGGLFGLSGGGGGGGILGGILGGGASKQVIYQNPGFPYQSPNYPPEAQNNPYMYGR